MNRLVIVIWMFIGSMSIGQELRCNVNVIAELTGNENNTVFKTLEQQLKEFINNTKWTDKNYAQNEQIDCNIVITITAYNNDSFTASLQVQSSRPVFNSTYSAPIYNFNDKDFNDKDPFLTFFVCSLSLFFWST